MESTTGQSAPEQAFRSKIAKMLPDTFSPPDNHPSNDVFRKVAGRTARAMGHPMTFAFAGLLVVVWGGTGHLFHYSDTWQLVINTGTTIVTFLMVFLIQNTQNRDSHAIHLKLDELIHANKHARNHMIALEELSDHELDELQHEFDRMACEKVAEVRAKSQREGHARKSETAPESS